MNIDFEKIKKNLPLIIIGLFFIAPLLKSKIVLVLIIIGFIYFVINKSKIGSMSKIFGNKNNMDNVIDVNNLKNVKKVRNLAVSLFLAILVLWLFFASIVIVDAGETGVYSLFGKVKDDELRSGFHLVIPLAKVTKMSIRTEEYTMSIAQGEGKKIGNDAIASLTKEGLSVDLDMTVFYKLEEDKASDVYRELGLTYDEKIIRPTIRTAIRDVIAQYNAKDIYSEKREEAASKILEAVKQNLEPRGIVVEEVLLRNVALPANLANSIQEKLQAEQTAQKYDFLLETEKKEKERIIIEAEGQRDAQKIINESLTTNYLYYLYINDLKSREGTIYVPTSSSTGMPLFRNVGN
jgi:regulator of protease activity HflC (stomatin/prohibitin superfamily)